MRRPVGALVRKDRPQGKLNIWHPGARDFLSSIRFTPRSHFRKSFFHSLKFVRILIIQIFLNFTTPLRKIGLKLFWALLLSPSLVRICLKFLMSSFSFQLSTKVYFNSQSEYQIEFLFWALLNIYDRRSLKSFQDPKNWPLNYKSVTFFEWFD